MKKIFLLMVLCSGLLSSAVCAEDYIVSIQKKQEDKYKNRWTLADYFDTQRKVRMQDMWLAMNTRNDPFEFYVGYDSAVMSDSDKTFSGRTSRAHVAAYAQFVGLEGQWVEEKTLGQGWNGALLIRVLGDSVQNTNLTLGYGIRNRKIQNVEYQNAYLHGSLSFYFTRYFGLDYLYRHLQSVTVGGTELSGSESEASVFIDYSFIRPYVSLKTVDHKWKSVTESQQKATGLYLGLKLFF